MPYTGRVTGKRIAWDWDHEVEVFLTDDERVLVYDGGKQTYYESDNPPEDLREWLAGAPSAYADAMHALGESPIVDL